jgi:hypothetical protein
MGPTTFGSGFTTFATAGTGDAFGVLGLEQQIFTPVGYTSGSALTTTETYTNQTLTSLGITPGTYTWTWGSGADADSFTLQIGPAAAAVPEPSTAIVAVFGAVAFIAYGWTRHRRGHRRQAAA